MENSLINRRAFIGAGISILASSSFPGRSFAEDRIIHQDIEQGVLEKACGSVVRTVTDIGHGTGFWVKDNPSGEFAVLTARHVVTNRQEHLGYLISNAEKLKRGEAVHIPEDRVKIAIFEDDQNLDFDYLAKPGHCKCGDSDLAKLLPEMHLTMSTIPDLCLLKPDTERFAVPPQVTSVVFRDLKNHPIQKGEPVFTIGFPNEDKFKLSRGTVVASNIVNTQIHLIQPYLELSMQVESGNSGGPLFDKNGLLIAIIVKKHIDNPNISWAISTEHILPVLNDNWNFHPDK